MDYENEPEGTNWTAERWRSLYRRQRERMLLLEAKLKEVELTIDDLTATVAAWEAAGPLRETAAERDELRERAEAAEKELTASRELHAESLVKLEELTASRELHAQSFQSLVKLEAERKVLEAAALVQLGYASGDMRYPFLREGVIALAQAVHELQLAKREGHIAEPSLQCTPAERRVLEAMAAIPEEDLQWGEAVSNGLDLDWRETISAGLALAMAAELAKRRKKP